MFSKKTISLSIAFWVNLGIASTAFAQGETLRASQGGVTGEANGSSAEPALSAGGRYVAFSSAAYNLLPNDTNGVEDIFVFDQAAHSLERISLTRRGSQAKGPSVTPSISADGRFVAFASNAPNLVAGDGNSVQDIFVYDRSRHRVRRVSVASDGTEANGRSGFPVISADGRFVAFWSAASNLVKASATTTDSSKDSKDDSKDQSTDKSKDQPTDTSKTSDSNKDSGTTDTAKKPSGNDENKVGDIFLHNLQTHETIRVSVTSDGNEADGLSDSPAISADGAFVAFVSEAKNLAGGASAGTRQVYVRDVKGKKTELASLSSRDLVGNGASEAPHLSADGRYVVFSSRASNLVNSDANGQEDIFIRDRSTTRTARVSMSSAGAEGNGASQLPKISADGQFVAFRSAASNLVTDDGNGRADYFVFDRISQTVSRPLFAADGADPNIGADDAPFDLSADGRYLSFTSVADNLVTNDSNALEDVFVRDRLMEGNDASDLQVTATVNPPSGPGPRVIQLTVTNAGSERAQDVVVTERLPQGIRLGDVTPSQGNCNNGRLMVCRMGTLEAGATAVISISGRRIRPKSAAGNFATANFMGRDTDPLNN